MRRIAATLVLCSLFPSSGQTAEKQAVPIFAGKALPTPAKQNVAWAAPETKLTKNQLSATKQLFDQGVADPRGCEYHSIKIVVGNVWGGGRVVETRGWVSGVRGKDSQKFAVCWNGLVYPVVSVGAKIDIRADVAAMFDVERKRRREFARKYPDRSFKRIISLWHEDGSTSHTTWLPIKACLLLRIGQVDLAEKYWQMWAERLDENTNYNQQHLDDPYLVLATDWSWALFDRAVCAHMRGDDKLALLSGEQLESIQEKLQATAAKRGFTTSVNGGIDSPLFGFLEPLPLLLGDQRRRAKQPPYRTALERGLDKFKTKGDRIKALIRDLETVAARQWGQPGGVSLNWDPVVKALIAQGPDAVEPLIRCIETDTRLTRSVSFGRDFFRRRNLLGVHEAAYAAVTGILETREFKIKHSTSLLIPEGKLGRKERAEAIRKYWEKFKGKPLAIRWYEVLADDRSSPDQWLEAAGQITRPVSFNKANSPARGESLRSKQNPSVTELMGKRVQELSLKGKAYSSGEMFRMHKACKLSLHLATWDADGSLPVIRQQTEDCRQTFKSGWDSGSWTTQILGSYIAKFTLKRAVAGDQKALGEYAAWIRGVAPQQLDSYVMNALEPMWTHATHPAIKQAADWLFNDKTSEWNPIFSPTAKHGGYHMQRLFGSPLINVAAFREQLQRMLADTTEAGYTIVRSAERIEIRVHNGWGTSTSTTVDDTLLPPLGTKTTFRLCDLYAYELRKHRPPRIGLFWPEEERDKAVLACAEFVVKFKPGKKATKSK